MKLSQSKIGWNDKTIGRDFKIQNFPLLKISHKKINKIFILFACLIFVSGFSLIPNADAFTTGKVITTATVGSPVISYRNILDSSTGDSPNVTFTLDASNFLSTVGITATFDSTVNFDNSQIDIITVDVIQGAGTSIEVDLTETDINSGVFTASFEATESGNISISYQPPASFAGRFQGTLENVVTGGTVILKDVLIDDFDESTGIGAVIDSVDLQLGTAEIAPGSGITVTMSFTNALIADPDAFPLDYLCLLHQSQPGASWEVLTYGSNIGGDLSTHNFGAGTVTNQLQPTSDGITVDPSGRYVLGFCNIGAPGGGGGGISRSGLVVQALGALALTGGGSQVNAPPTLGMGQNQKRIVDGGFSFNDNPIDVLQYYTPYPLITTPVGQNNTIKLKIYEEKGLDNIAHVGLSYGLGKGEIFNEGRATIEYDRTFDGVESVTLFDPEHVLGKVNVTTDDIRCSDKGNAVCREFSFHHVFREPLEYNMVATNIWDFERNGWQNYFNHGIQIVGDSMNPPEEYSGIYKGHIYPLTETGKNTAIDDDGNNWTFDRIWNRDYIQPVNVDSDILNQKKIDAIESLGFQYSDGQEIFGYARVDHRFTDLKNQEQIEAQTILNNLCPECKKEPFEKINNIFSYDLPDRHSKLDNPETVTLMKLEDQKARQFLQTFFEKIYHKSVD